MASSSLSTSLLLFLIALFSVLATSAVARPCKTFLVSYSFSSSSSSATFSASALEVPQISASADTSPRRYFSFYRVVPLRFYQEIFNPTSSVGGAAAATEPLAATIRLPSGIHRPALPHPSAPSIAVGSLRERARDILVVVAGLLFGAGCGALTTATLYFAWYLFSNRDDESGSHGYDFDDMEDGLASPKKMGYTDLPAAPATPVSPLKEGYEGN